MTRDKAALCEVDAAHPVVGVVIPMYNGEATIEETLASVLAQTYRALEIVVVDDGSSDRGAATVERHMADDTRLRLIHQANAGVAAARNAGARALGADYLAFVDADDLWAPDKIALQMELMRMFGERSGLVYCWYALIDERSHVIGLDHQPSSQGSVLRELCRGNFVGNGSSILVRRAVFEQVGGFDRSLRDQEAQGCEDLLFCLSAAEQTEFRVVPRPLIGYRLTHGNMSSDAWRMRRSAEIVLGRVRERHPHYAWEAQQQLDGMTVWLISRSLRAGKLRVASSLYRTLLASNPRMALGESGRLGKVLLQSHLTGRAPDVISRIRPNRKIGTLYTEAAW